MKEGLRLKIGTDWCVIDASNSISIEMTSPLWNDSGSFSYPFTVPYKANRHIFNAAEVPESDVNLKNFRKSFELYVNGVGLLYGDVICTSDYIDTDEDAIELELRSGNANFDDAIDGKSLRDIDFKEDVYLGKLDYYFLTVNDTRVEYQMQINENEIYPVKNYCNIPIVANNKESTSERKGVAISASRIATSPNIFALYVLKKIMQFSNFSYDEENDCELYHIEDFKRMILLNMLFKYKQSDAHVVNGYQYYYSLYATSEALPDIDMSTFIESFKNAFGMRIISDNRLQKNRVVLLRSIFRSNEVIDLNVKHTYSVRKEHVSFDGLRLKYSTDDGEEFSYDDYSFVKDYDNYESILNEWTGWNETKKEEDNVLKISKDTGNFFRTRVDKSSFDKAALFEVAQFLPYKVEGFGEDKGDIEDLTISFTPVITTTTANCDREFQRGIPDRAFYVNVDVSYIKNRVSIEGTYNKSTKVSAFSPGSINSVKEVTGYDCGFMIGILRTTPEGGLSDSYTEVRQNADGFGNSEWVRTSSVNEVTSDSVSLSGAVYDYNGSDEGIGTDLDQLITLKLWTGKQNLKPMETVDKSTGEVTLGYNNNPTGPLPNRGLATQFLSEYFHFMQNRKPIEIVCQMEIAELANLHFDKYYRINGYRCLIDKASFNVSSNGISEVTLNVFLI